VGAVTTYTFSNVVANHTIAATFAAKTSTVTASAGTGGSISPTGATSVNYGANQTYTITPSTGYSVAAVTVDGASVGAVTTYTFSNVVANHTIAATFVAQTSTVTASAGTGGTISPTGTTSVNYGANQTYTITPSTGYSVASVTVDGASVGAITAYTFSNVTANHTITATFVAQTPINDSSTVSDSTGTDSTTQTVTNVATLATVTASSQDTSLNQLAKAVIDGYTDGYSTGDETHEWAAVGEKTGAWLQLTWPSAQKVNRIVLYDRPNTDDQITAGTITFSDGSSINVGPLDDKGNATEYNFATRSITSLKLAVTGVSDTTYTIGLAEIKVFAAPVADAGASQVAEQGEQIQLKGSGSYDPNGKQVTYQWKQTSGVSVSLSSTTAADPTFTVPAGLSSSTVLTFQLVTGNGALTSAPSTVSVIVLVPGSTGTNVAPAATVTASSESTSTKQLAVKAVDGYTDGYSAGNYTHEWATAGQKKGAWIQLTWPVALPVGKVVLYDRPNTSDRITSGTITFSDGSTVSVGALDNKGKATSYSFATKKISSLKLTVTGVSSTTANVGLAEIQVFAAE
jgi:hypothetical protein